MLTQLAIYLEENQAEFLLYTICKHKFWLDLKYKYILNNGNLAKKKNLGDYVQKLVWGKT